MEIIPSPLYIIQEWRFFNAKESLLLSASKKSTARLFTTEKYHSFKYSKCDEGNKMHLIVTESRGRWEPIHKGAYIARPGVLILKQK